jgi:hypothetical protein
MPVEFDEFVRTRHRAAALRPPAHGRPAAAADLVQESREGCMRWRNIRRQDTPEAPAPETNAHLNHALAAGANASSLTPEVPAI